MTDADWWSWLRQRVETHGHVVYAMPSWTTETFWKVTARATGDLSSCAFPAHPSRQEALASIPALQADPENARYNEWGIQRYEAWVLVVDENPDHAASSLEDEPTPKPAQNPPSSEET